MNSFITHAFHFMREVKHRWITGQLIDGFYYFVSTCVQCVGHLYLSYLLSVAKWWRYNKM